MDWHFREPGQIRNEAALIHGVGALRVAEWRKV